MSGPVVITGGGTGGHVFPMQAVAEALRAQGLTTSELRYVGSRRGQEGRLLGNGDVALTLLAGVFIWKNSTSLVPPHADEQREDFVVGKDAASGFVNLLRRNIPTRDIFAACFAEWKKSAAPSGKFSSARLQQAEAV